MGFFGKSKDEKLLEAARKGDVVAVRTALASGAFVECQDSTNGRTPLHLAAYIGQVQVAQLLLEQKANVEAKSKIGDTPLHWASSRGKSFSAIDEIKPEGKMQVARLLLENGANLNARNDYGETPLHKAAVNDRLEMVKLFLDRGAERDSRCRLYGDSPLHKAVDYGSKAVAELLLDLGTDKEMKNGNGETPLLKAVSKNFRVDEEVLELLLDRGAEVNAKSNRDGNTALHYVAGANDRLDDDYALPLLHLLVAYGADRDAKNNNGKTAFDIAKNDKRRRVCSPLYAVAARRPSRHSQAVTQQSRVDKQDAKVQVAAAAGAATEADALNRQQPEAAQKLETFGGAAVAMPTPPLRQPSLTVPPELAAWLTSLELSEHATRLVNDHKLHFVEDCSVLDREDLLSSGLAKVEAERFLKAASKLSSGTTKRLTVKTSAPEASPAPAVSRARICALVIGINAYSDPPGKLGNAVADARAVHEALSAMPGAASTLLTDCTKFVLEQALVDFRDGTGVCKGRGMRVEAAAAAASAMPAEGVRTLGIVFFAGHGLQVNGRNYLVPADFRVPNKNDKLDVMLRDTAKACVSLHDVEQILEDADVTAGSILLDCCRNVPDFLATLGAKRSTGTRALEPGMSAAVPKLRDLMVTFATAPGMEALDRSTRVPTHSPFTAALLKAFATPKRLLELNPFLTDEVSADSGGQQRPHVGGSYGTDAGNIVLGV